jgi:geranylgeranyl pyrophosphate synthase
MMELSTHKGTNNSTSRRVIPAFKHIEDKLDQVQRLIKKQLTIPAKTDEINQLLEYVKAHSGKMLRPGLVLLSYCVVRDASCEKKTRYAIRNTQYELIRVAAIVEMIHNATLLHDDVIDDGQKRRGVPTINNLWGNESAVLMGDFLLSRVFRMCSDLQPKVTTMIAAAAARTCEGELQQVIQRRNWQWRRSRKGHCVPCCALSESEYIDIITEKSAALFSNCCGLGALLANANEAQVQSLERFGLNAGIAFQITDDLLDLIGNESQTGKTSGSDVNNNKLTLAVIHLLGMIDDKEKERICSELNPPTGTRKKELLKMLSSYGSLEYARSRAEDFVNRALLALTSVKKNWAKEALIETAKFMANRAI